jgi:TatD DNase family protein
MIIDTHCHLNDKRYYEDLPIVLQRSQSKDVKITIIPGADPRELPLAVELCEKHDELYFGVGVHPYDIEFYDREFLKKYITHPKCVAVGECGLDYYRLPEDDSQKDENIRRQKEVFIDQIDLAKEFNKPLIIHIREASKDSLDLLIEHDSKAVGGVLHCFNASESLLPLSKHGFYFGIGGVVTFKNAKKLVEILPKIPKDRLLVETDGPYLTPHPHRGERNEPSYTSLVVAKMSEILEIDEDSLKETLYKNTKRLFRNLNI